MKKQYILIFSLICSLFVNAQNYHPFPYDSVFFETSSSDRPLLPLVKSNNPENMIMPINNMIDWGLDSYYIDDEFWMNAEPVFFPYQSWLGKISLDEEKIIFETAMENQIPIDLSHNIGESDTVFIQVPGTISELFFHVNITYNELEISPEDTIKHYRFNLLDENYEEIDFNDSSLEWEAPLNFEDQVFSISKHNGILSSPSFYYFPNSRQYTYKAKIAEVLNLNHQHAYTVFSNQVGDEIHTEYLRNYFLNRSKETSKKVYVDQEYHESLNAFISTIDVWTRKDTTTFLFEDETYLRDFTTSFNQITDTTYLDDYTDLNRIIPDGFPHNYSSNNKNGYFYRVQDSSFIKNIRTAYFNSGEFGVEINPSSEGEFYFSQFRLHTGGKYYESSGGYGNQSWYKLLYYNINGEIGGEPINESYLLEINDESFHQNQLIIKNNSIFINDSDKYENARIYNLNGEFISFYNKDDLHLPINIQDLKAGIYIISCWDGQKLHSYKFVKS